METVLLTGASGFVGHWIARYLPRSLTLRLFVRAGSDLSLLDRAAIPYERVNGDLLDPGSIADALEGVDAVIHAAGFISFDRRDARQLRQANLEASLNLFHAAAQRNVPRVLYTASIFALGHAARGAVAERSQFNAAELLDIPYIRAKYELEMAATRLVEEGMPLIALYPGLCLGPEDRRRSSSGLIGEWLRGRVPALVEGGICFVDVRDAAAAHVTALLEGETGGRYLAPGHNLTHRYLFEHLAALAGKPAPRLVVPQRLAVLGATMLETCLPRPPLYRDMARLMGYYWWYDDRRTRAKLPIRYRPLRETLLATLNGFRLPPRPPPAG